MSCACSSPSCLPPPPTPVEWQHRALVLAWITVLYNLVEGGVSITFGLSDGSISLAGFGLDSLVEVGSAMVVLWRLQGGDLERERRATRIIGILFLLLALSVTAGSVLQLVRREHPHTTVPGMVISGLSLSFMVFLWRAKRRVARGLNSAALAADAACSLACLQLSAVLLVGSLGFELWPSLWWADSTAALVLALLITREGLGMVRAARRADFQGGCGCG